MDLNNYFVYYVSSFTYNVLIFYFTDKTKVTSIQSYKMTIYKYTMLTL